VLTAGPTRAVRPLSTLPVLALAFALAAPAPRLEAQVRLRTASDRAALREWFVLLADAQFYRTTGDVTDCAALVRHALREALRPHTTEWLRLARLPSPRLAPDVVERPLASGDSLPLFLVSERPRRVAEFADARTLVTLNTQPLGREAAAARPGDLLYFRQPRGEFPDHLMVFLGPTATEPEGVDWVVYHTGPDAAGPGEVRKVRLSDLQRHPSPRWRPTAGNPAFAGVFRLTPLS
jgi:uncharacterized protein YfaT (DUF1175 family)